MSTDTDDPTDTDDESLRPSDAVDLYLDTRKNEVSATTLNAHRYRTSHFVRFCEEKGIDDMKDVTGKVLQKYRLWRREDGDLNTVSLHTQLSTMKVFLRFCENIDALEQGTHEKLLIPSLKDGEGRRDTVISSDRATEIIEWLEQFEYSSLDHTLMLLLWRTGMRVGEVKALDVDDYDEKNQTLTVAHRPEGGTSLKNGESGQRVVAIREDTCRVLTDYIERTRPDVTDSNGREPLLATAQGRPTTSTLRRHVYRCTQPCQRQNECPHDRDMDECEARGYGSNSDCPSVVSPHDIRRSSITHWLSSDVPSEAIGDRMDVSKKIMDKHYDKRSEEGKAEQRRKWLDDV